MYQIPHDETAEKAVIGSMLLDKEAIQTAIKLLEPEDFYNDVHINLCKTIYDLYNDSKPVDIVTVDSKSGGTIISYLVELAGMVSTTANMKHYAGIVKGKSIRRKYIKAGNEIIEMASIGEYENIIDFRNDAMNKIDIQVKDDKTKDGRISTIILNVLDDLERKYMDGEKGKLQYGFEWLDKKTGGMYNSDLTYIAARPSIGKTAFACQIGLNVARRGIPVLIYNLEMGDKQLVNRLISNAAGVEHRKIRTGNEIEDKEWVKITNASIELSELQIIINDNSGLKIEEIRADCRDYKNKNQLGLVIIDYLQLCDTVKKTNSTNDRISHISRQCKLLAKELEVPVIVLSQLSRANEHDKRRPRLMDLRDSGSIEQDADNVLFLHDESSGEYEESQNKPIHPIQLIIGKQRNGDRDIYTDIGFVKNIQRFVNLDRR